MGGAGQRPTGQPKRRDPSRLVSEVATPHASYTLAVTKASNQGRSVTSRANELLYSEDDRRELAARFSAVRQLVRSWRWRRLNPDTFPAYLVEMAAASERLFQWIDELWLYGTGGRRAFDTEIETEDAADPATLSPAQIDRKRNRAKWSGAAALAGRLANEARVARDADEARRLERAFVRTVLPWLPAEFHDKDAMFDRATLISMLRGDQPKTLTLVSLDDHPEFADPDLLPKVVPCDDPSEFPPATASCRRIGLFAKPSHFPGNLNGQTHQRIETPDTDAQQRAECQPR